LKLFLSGNLNCDPILSCHLAGFSF
jgi:hypothetical protein